MSPVTQQPNRCPRCGGGIRLDEGVCVRCLLREGLQDSVEASPEAFEDVLAEAAVADTCWHLGNYEVLEEIARGGMGVVYRARQQHSRRIVALKRILAYQADSHEALVRFRRETEASAKLDHPHILPVYEIGESDDGLPFYSMKYATGGSLRAAIPALHCRPDDCVRLMAKVARAVDYAHREGILHRDLQPGNILLDAHGEPFVSDFGLAKWLQTETDLTYSLTTFGTPGYIAPEQAESAGEISPAADIYSLGAILFHLLADRPPIVGTNVLSVIRRAAASPAPKLRSLAPALDRDLETICARCLERDPRARYPSAGDLAADLERWLENRPILARPVSVTTRTWRWSRRNPALASVAFICLSLGGVVFLLLWDRDRPPQILPAEKSIAVLPFENLSDDRQDAYFADGMQEEILSDLARIADLKVISRTSTRSYGPEKPRNSREISQQLGVAHLLEGSVQRLNERVRIRVRLIDARRDSDLWAQTYDRKVTDIFAMQSEIAQTIANQLQVKITAGEKAAIAAAPTSDLVANNLYLEAVALETNTPGDKSQLQAIALLEQATARDPHFLRAYCALARIQLNLYEGRDHTPQQLERARASVARATQLQPDSGEVHLIRARYLARGLGDYDEARAELELARRVLPNNASVYHEEAVMDRRQGRWNEALRNFDRAIELDPRDLSYLTDAAMASSSARKPAAATQLCQRVLAISPHDRWVQILLASQPLNERGDIRPLRAAVQAILAEEPGSTLANFDNVWTYLLMERDPASSQRALNAIPPEGLRGYGGSIQPREWFVGYVARLANQTDAARAAFIKAAEILEQHLREHPADALSWSLFGRVKAMLGEKGEATEAGQRACALWPLSKEPFWGMRSARNLAAIYATIGEKDLAIEQLAAHAGEPDFIHYGELMLHPDWDPLRGDPRFEKVVALLAPKGESAK